MTKFIVEVREVHVQSMRVEAESAEEAIKKVVNGEGEIVENCMEYSHTLDSENWTVRQEPKGS